MKKMRLLLYKLYNVQIGVKTCYLLQMYGVIIE